MLNIEANLNSSISAYLTKDGFDIVMKYVDSCIEELENNGIFENELEILKDRILRSYITVEGSEYKYSGTVLETITIFGGRLKDDSESPFIDNKFIIKIDTNDNPNIILDK